MEIWLSSERASSERVGDGSIASTCTVWWGWGIGGMKSLLADRGARGWGPFLGWLGYDVICGAVGEEER